MEQDITYIPLNTQSVLDPSNSFPSHVVVPNYIKHRDSIKTGIVHLSVGNFHRAHEAMYISRLLEQSSVGDDGYNWGITGIGVVDIAPESLKAHLMQRQDNLYTLTEFGSDPMKDPRTEVIGSIINYIHAPSHWDDAMTALTDPNVKIVTMTITEGGYNMTQDGHFNLHNKDIVADLARENPTTVWGLLYEAIKRRYNNGTVPFTILSCDNMRHNGTTTRNALHSYVTARNDTTISEYISNTIAFPNSMVDRITPATSPDDLTRLNKRNKIDDALPVFCESYHQWIIQDLFPSGRPRLENLSFNNKNNCNTHNIIFTDDVTAYEQIKLQMLNASHSMLALPGWLLGKTYVYEAIRLPTIMEHIKDYLKYDVIPYITPPKDSLLSLDNYASSIFERFSNPAIQDQISRIMSDSLSKWNVFIKPTVENIISHHHSKQHDNKNDQESEQQQCSATTCPTTNQQQHPLDRIAWAVAGLIRYINRTTDTGFTSDALQEPMLTHADTIHFKNEDIEVILRQTTLFKGWNLADYPHFIQCVAQHMQSQRAVGCIASLAAIHSISLANEQLKRQ